jgi:hypothetical protein
VDRKGTIVGRASQIVLQDAIDSSDVIGRWDWDITSDRLYADALVLLLFNVDPATAETGAPLDLFLSGMHCEDRERTRRLIMRSAEAGRSYVAEYRVYSADGKIRWVLARGRFTLDEAGRPLRGGGLLIDITQNKLDEVAYVSDTVWPSDHPLERAAEHCLAAREAIQELPHSVIHHLSDMLLLEIGRGLSTLSDISPSVWKN